MAFRRFRRADARALRPCLHILILCVPQPYIPQTLSSRTTSSLSASSSSSRVVRVDVRVDVRIDRTDRTQRVRVAPSSVASDDDVAARARWLGSNASSSSAATSSSSTPPRVDARRRARAHRRGVKLSPTSSSRANAAIGELGGRPRARRRPWRRASRRGRRRNAAVVGGALAAAVAVKYVFDTPSRTYVDGENTVGKEYDAWTEEGILEYYWGEHIHLGWYSDEELAEGAGTLLGCKKKDFIQAKFDFVDEMAKWSETEKPAEVLDVGCGIGGTSRHLAKTFGEGTTVTGITLSPNQVKRATELAKEQGVPNAQFRVMNALEMEFEDNTFDLVWACEKRRAHAG